MQLEPLGKVGERRLGRLAPRIGDRGGPRRAAPGAGRRLRARRWHPAVGRPPPTARWRFADSAFSTRLSSPRNARETCRASSSRSAPAAPIRRRNVPTDPPLFQVTTPRPRRIRHEADSPTSLEPAARAGASSAGPRTRDGSGRPPGSAIRGTGIGRATRPSGNVPRRSATRRRASGDAQRGARPRLPVGVVPCPAEAHGQTRDGRLARDARSVPRPASSAVTVAGPGWVDRGELGAQGDHESRSVLVTVATINAGMSWCGAPGGSVRRSGRRCAGGRRTRPRRRA